VKEMGSRKSNNNYAQDLRAGELVEVRSEKEILATLDENGRLEMLPFMPEMLKYCGMKVRVFKRAHKTCDTIEKSGLRLMDNAVHLEGLRCDGKAHGGCQAGCLIFWKEAWLKRVGAAPLKESIGSKIDCPAGNGARLTQHRNSCTPERLFSATRVGANPVTVEEEIFSCQATELRRATSYLSTRDVRQYLRDVTSGNIGLLDLGRGMLVLMFNTAIRTLHHIAGVLARCLTGRTAPNTAPASVAIQAVSGGGRPSSLVDVVIHYLRLAARRMLDLLVEYPHIKGKLRKTPAASLHLQPGELVQVKSKKEIAQTLDIHSSNRGLGFNIEMLPYCGGQFRVLRRVEKIINEKTGKMMRLPNDCIVLDGVTCRAYYHKFCPRNIFPYWREIWLRRVDPIVESRDRNAKMENKVKHEGHINSGGV
jgi:hypothetical protein